MLLSILNKISLAIINTWDSEIRSKINIPKSEENLYAVYV
jgi:hypothetical protein